MPGQSAAVGALGALGHFGPSDARLPRTRGKSLSRGRRTRGRRPRPEGAEGAEGATYPPQGSKLTFNVNRPGKIDGCDAPRPGPRRRRPVRARMLLDVMYEVTSCVLSDVVRALRRPHRLRFEDR